MNRENLLLLILALLLLAGMICTLLLGGNRSRHGYGLSEPARPDGGAYGTPVRTG